MNSLNPYLTFNGNCLEAMEYYKDCLGGELSVSTFGEMPSDQVREEDKNLVMHAKLSSDGIVLMASDTNSQAGEVNFGSNITLNLNADSLENAEKYFNHLADGGKITMPFEESFWGAKFGMLTDKYGVHWMVNCPHGKK
ncbi:MAG: VOC family protein [Bacteroidia bacterium]